MIPMGERPAEQKRDEMLLRLLKTPPQPRKGRQDDSVDQNDGQDEPARHPKPKK